MLLCESLEPRLLLSVDSSMLPTDIQVALPGAPYVAADADGNVYIAAKRADPDVSKYTPDIWLRKYSSDGGVQWTNDLRYRMLNGYMVSRWTVVMIIVSVESTLPAVSPERPISILPVLRRANFNRIKEDRMLFW